MLSLQLVKKCQNIKDNVTLIVGSSFLQMSYKIQYIKKWHVKIKAWLSFKLISRNKSKLIVIIIHNTLIKN